MIVVAAALVRGGRLLVAQRSYPPELAGHWELPGGKVEPGEDERGALVRECREELGVPVTVAERLGPDLPTAAGSLLRTYVATLADPAAHPVAHEHAALEWVDAEGLTVLAWLPTNLPLLPHLRRLLGGTSSGPARAD